MIARLPLSLKKVGASQEYRWGLEEPTTHTNLRFVDRRGGVTTREEIHLDTFASTYEETQSQSHEWRCKGFYWRPHSLHRALEGLETWFLCSRASRGCLDNPSLISTCFPFFRPKLISPLVSLLGSLALAVPFSSHEIGDVLPPIPSLSPFDATK